MDKLIGGIEHKEEALPRPAEPTPMPLEPLVEVTDPQLPTPTPPLTPVPDLNAVLRQRTPYVFVTPLIIAINVLVFVMMSASGVPMESPPVQALVDWGGNLAPQTLNGQEWRLVTSIFVHAGIVHLAFNIWALLAAGVLVERLAGNFRFLVLYLLSGIMGSLASCYFHPHAVCVGASGAIFGVFGALIGLALCRGALPLRALAKLRNSGVAFVGYNLVFGFFVPKIDVSAHIGGLVTGFAGGCVLSRSLAAADSFGLRLRFLVLAGGGSVLALLFLTLIPRPSDIAGELNHFAEIDEQTVAAANVLRSKYDKGESSAEEFARGLSREILPPLRENEARLAALKDVPGKQKEFVASALNYTVNRRQAIEALVQWLKDGDANKLAEFNERSEVAAKIVAELNGDRGK